MELVEAMLDKTMIVVVVTHEEMDLAVTKEKANRIEIKRQSMG